MRVNVSGSQPSAPRAAGPMRATSDADTARIPVQRQGPPPSYPPPEAPDETRPPKPREIARARRQRRERRYRLVGLVVLVLTAAMVLLGTVRGWSASRQAGPGAGQDAVARVPGAGDGGAGAGAVASYPASGPGTFGYAAGTGPVIGTDGTLYRFRVAVEDSTGQAPDQFAALAGQVLGDRRGWTAAGAARFQRVPQNAPAEFTLYLATPGTSQQMCAKGGLHTRGYISCHLAGQVIINLARWLAAVPGYGAPLSAYRAYALNHEIGRQLGYGNAFCPGPGQPAPVMQQQSLGLSGCVANAWPYLAGKLYQGNPIP